ncbi:MAG: hypothetical protein MUC36_05555 [Planctomycetes bacterium]|jgi:hypothetical protein|nr:hypothetical protein [Planctomycetota bacterium]
MTNRPFARFAALGAVLVCDAVAQPPGPQSYFDVATFGAIPDDGADDAAAIQQALDLAMQTSGDVTLEFRPGSYQLATPQYVDLMLRSPMVQSASTLTIIGNGARLEVVNETRRGVLYLVGVHDVTIRDLDIDYVHRGQAGIPDGTPSLVSQGTVKVLHRDPVNNSLYTGVEIELHAGFRPPLPPAAGEPPVFFAHYHDPATHQLRERTVNRGFTSVVALGHNRYLLNHGSFSAANDNVQIGDIAAIPLNSATMFQGQIRPRNHAIVVSRSTNVTLEGVNIFSAPAMGVVAEECTGTTFRRCGIGPRHVLALSNAPRPSTVVGSPPGPSLRFASSTRDGIHIRQPRAGVTVDSCAFDFTGDDAIAVRSVFARVDMVDPATGVFSLLEYLPPLSAGPIAVGDTLRILRPSTGYSREVTVLRQSPWATHLNGAVSAVLCTPPFSAAIGDYVECYANAGEGSLLRNNRISNSASRGIVFKGRASRIENNTIGNTHGPGINLCSELFGVPNLAPSDHEAGTLFGNVIVGNNLTRCCVGQSPHLFLKGAINLTNEAVLPGVLDLHRGNQILGNVIKESYGTSLYISNATGTIVTGNEFRLPRRHLDAVAVPLFDVERLVNLQHASGTRFDSNRVYDWSRTANLLLELGSSGTVHVPAPLGFIVH